MRGNPLLLLYGSLFSNRSNGSFMCSIPQTEQYIPVFGTPVVVHWLGSTKSEWPNNPPNHDHMLYH